MVERTVTTSQQRSEQEPTPGRLLFVGLGQWGITWIDVLRESPHWDIVGYVDRDEDRIGIVVEKENVARTECFTDLGEAIDETDATAVLCAVPPNAHKPVANTAFEHGLHVLTEKPLSGSLKDAQEMIDAAAAADRKLMVSQNYRFSTRSRTMRQVLEREFVGSPGYVSVRFARKLDESVVSDFRLEMKYPLLRDMSIHHFDQMRYVLGLEPVSAHAQSTTPNWSDFKHAPVSSVIFEMENGVMVDYFGSHVSQGEATTWNGDWRVSCSGAEVVWRDSEIEIQTQSPVDSVEHEGMVEKARPGLADKGLLKAQPVSMEYESRAYSLYEFSRAIEEDRKPETSATDNIKTLAMVHAATTSCETGERVLIDDILG